MPGRLSLPVILFVVSLPARAVVAAPSVAVSTDRKKAEVGETVHCKVIIEWADTEQVIVVGVRFEKLDGLKIVGSSGSAITLPGSERAVHRQEFTYELRAEREGTCSTGNVIVEYLAPSAHVMPKDKLPAEGANAAKKPLVVRAPGITIHVRPRNPWRQLAWGGLAGVVVLAVILVVAFLSRLKSASNKGAATELPGTHREAEWLDRLESLRSKSMVTDPSEYCAHLAMILEGYLHGEGATAALPLPEQAAQQLQSILEFCESVRFGGHRVSTGDLDRATNSAIRIVKNTVKLREHLEGD